MINKLTPYECGRAGFKASCKEGDNPFACKAEARQWQDGWLEEASIARLKIAENDRQVIGNPMGDS